MAILELPTQMIMNQAYITHQRRPALIPAGIDLSPQEELSVRLRTGFVDSTNQSWFTNNNIRMINETSLTAKMTKRKADWIDDEDEDMNQRRTREDTEPSV